MSSENSTSNDQDFAYLVVNPGGGEVKGYATEQQAKAHAQALGYLVVKAPVIADYRRH